jgi:putative tricarboxylic transport membrane protein
MTRLLALCALLIAVHAHAQAPAWKPTRPIELINPASPGGSVDLMNRSLKKFMEDNKLTDQPISVVYKTGANGAIALDYVNQQPGSGETVLAVSHTFLSIGLTGESKQDWRDLTPLGILFKEFHVTAVRTDSPLKSGKDLIEKMRRDPSSISYGFFGNRGNHLHLAAAIPLRAAGVDIKQMTNVPYRSGPEAMSAVLGGHLDVALVSAVNPAANVQAGKMRVLTQTTPERGGGYLKDIPTWKELGVNVEYATAQGFMGPKTMPPQAVPYWEGVLARFAKDPEWQKLLERSLWANAYMSAAEMKKYYESEFIKVKGVLEELALTKQ